LDVVVRTRNIDVPEAIRAVAREKVSRLTRFLDGMDHAEVLFAEERNPRIQEKDWCEITVAGHGHLVRAKAAGVDQLAAVDRVVDKLEHQIVKLKGKLVSRSHPRRQVSVDSRGTEQALDSDNPDEERRIVKTKTFAIKPMTPEEAALNMDLLGHGFYFFTNADTDRAAVVYRRDDGDVGLIEAG
jgi:putative sigma-54 modulation protein